MTKRLYVGNISWDTSHATLQATFAADGRTVTDTHLVLDRETKRPRGFAFIEMASAEDARAAIEALDGMMLDGRELWVKEALERQNKGAPKSSPPVR